jgi:hypothetical protein
MRYSLVVVLAVLCVPLMFSAEQPEAKLRFEVTLAKDVLDKPTTGRVLVAVSKSKRGDPRRMIGQTGMDAAPVLGCDAKEWTSEKSVILDAKSMIFPLANLNQLPAGEYSVQAVFAFNPDLRIPNAAGNVMSDPVRVKLDPAQDTTIKLQLTKIIPEQPLKETESIKFLKFRSEKLSKFHGRDMFLRVGIKLPPNHATDKEKTYPLRVHIGGFGSRYTGIYGFSATTAPMIIIHLDGCGPLGDPYQVDSANHGPYGAALTEELIPHIEKTYRGIGKPEARVLDGGSTGGWVSTALQIFYPDFFNGAWAHCPDSVDFRAFELINIYSDKNAYVNRFGFERPAKRTISGDTVYTMRHEVLLERVLGLGDEWALSGRDWGSWNATFGPKGKDGNPVPLWDGKTGALNREVLDHWRKYDLRAHLEKNWATLGPKLDGKLRIYVGEADDYFLNNAVHHLDDFMKVAKPKIRSRIVFKEREDHGVNGISEPNKIKEMLEVTSKAK